MNEQKNNGRGIFYGVIGVATLVVAVIGATFAYFTASAGNNEVIKGNMATVKLALDVRKVSTADDNIGMIPMSNSMIEPAVVNASGKGVCVDNNGNPVCQIYRIVLTNDSSAGQFVDGYVALKGGSGSPTDYTGYTNPEGEDATTQGMYPIDGLAGQSTTLVGTTMRWAQVFAAPGSGTKVIGTDTDNDGACDTEGETCIVVPDKYSTAGTQVLGDAEADTPEQVVFTSIANQGTSQIAAKNLINIRTEYAPTTTVKAIGDKNSNNTCDAGDDEKDCFLRPGVLTSLSISGNNYDVIGSNYIRVSAHQWLKNEGGAENYSRESDVTSALIFNHNILAGESAVYYVAVWLTETGTDQTAGATTTVGETSTPIANANAATFFKGNVTFISAQGSEVSATFANHARVPSQG